MTAKLFNKKGAGETDACRQAVMTAKLFYGFLFPPGLSGPAIAGRKRGANCAYDRPRCRRKTRRSVRQTFVRPIERAAVSEKQRIQGLDLYQASHRPPVP